MPAIMARVGEIGVTLYSDPGCPWAYSAIPAQTVLRWRYGSQLRWRVVTIGLAEDTSRYAQAGYTPARMAANGTRYRRYGMPFLAEPRARLTATGRACRAIVATRLLDPARELEVLRALQLAWFNTTLLLDEDQDIAVALEPVQGLDVPAVIAALEDEATAAAYAHDKRLTRTAEGGPTHFQGRARQTDGPVRYSAPSVVFECDGRRLEAGGFQPVEAYDVLVANLDCGLERREPAQEPLAALREFPSGLVTQEVAAIMAPNNAAPDREAAEQALIELAAERRVRRSSVGDGALWQAV